MPDDPRLTVFLVDDDASVRDSLALFLSLRGFRTAVFASAEDFVHALSPGWHGCLITDLKMPGMSGLELQTELARRALPLPVVVLTAHGDVDSARLAFKGHAVDFLRKPYDETLLIAAIEAAFAAERERLARADDDAHRESVFAELSEREREVMSLMVRGLSHKAIGDELGISPRTVEAHRASLMRKLGVGNLAELIHLLNAATADSALRQRVGP